MLLTDNVTPPQDKSFQMFSPHVQNENLQNQMSWFIYI